jgi:acyl-coenzyme A synthetase/AMP-(fatty) acid ligase
MARNCQNHLGDHQRYKEFLPFQANISLVTALRDEVGYYRITGRVDDVVIVSGHNLGTLPLKMLLTSIRQLLSQQL